LGDDFNEESLETSKNELCARKYRLEQEAIENREAVLEYESANIESDDRLARMSKIEEALKNQRSHLDSFKNEMEKFDDPVQEIERLQEKTRQYDQETRAIQSFLRISNKISEDISRTNARMQSVFDNREKRVLEFEQFIEQVLP
jgi:myosin heavy subunit